MSAFLRLLFSWSVRRFALFVLVVAAMAAFVKVKEAWDRLPALAAEVESLERHEQLLGEEVARQRAAALAALADISRMEEPALRRRLATLRLQIAAIENNRASGLGLALQAARGEGSALAREAAAGFRLRLLQREQALILARLAALGRGGQLRLVDARIEALDSRIAALRRRISEIEREHPVLSRIERVPGVRRIEGPWRELRAARRELASAEAERVRLAAAGQAVRGAFDRARTAYHGAAGALRDVQSPGRSLREQIERRRAKLEGHWASRAWEAVRPVLGWAFWVTLLIVLTPPAVKAFWFFVVAPFAVRLPPVRIGTSANGGIGWADRRRSGVAAGSAVSFRLLLRGGEEALLRPLYLQSSPVGALTGSRLLLSPAMPFGSFAAGLTGLTYIRAERETWVTVSATADPIDEVGAVEVPAGESLVLRPRALIGVVQQAGRPVRIERVWTAGRLASWLSLRLRHIVFRGPCLLLLKGARGIAIEPAGSGRRIAGAATLGWSGGLCHRIDRSEAYLAFLTGKQSLFNDRFDGHGIVLYEEMPRPGAQGGLFGRGLEGLDDAMLRIFGL